VARHAVSLEILSTVAQLYKSHLTNNCSRWMALKVTQGHRNCLYSTGQRSAVSNRWFLGPTRVLNTNSISIASEVFAGLTRWQTDRQTDGPRYSVIHNRWHLRTYTVMCSNNRNAQLYLIRVSLGPPESSTQTASRSLYPFLQNSLGDRQTNTSRYLVDNNRQHLHA